MLRPIRQEACRVFAPTLGHNNATVADPCYLDLVTSGLLWSVNTLDDAHLKLAQKVPRDETPTRAT
jgi:type 1 glutamine amidotransferase